MPLGKYDGALPAGLTREDDPSFSVADASFVEWGPAVFNRESDISGFLTAGEMPVATAEEDQRYRTGVFNPLEYNKTTGSEWAEAAPLQGEYAGLKSPGQVDFQNAKNDKLKVASMYSQELPWYKTLPVETAGGVVSVVSIPELLLGIGKVPFELAEQVGKRAIRFAGSSLFSTSMQEYLLTQQQGRYHRTIGENIGTIAGSTALGGTVGGALGIRAGRVTADKTKNLETTFDATNTDINTLHTQTKDGGAAEVLTGITREQRAEIEASDLTEAGKKVAIDEAMGQDSKLSRAWFMKGRANPINIMTKALPDMRMYLSNSSVTRNTADDLFATNMITEGNVKGRGNVSLDAVRDTYERQTNVVLNEAFSQSYVKYAGRKFFRKSGKMNQVQWNQSIRNAITSGLKSDDTEVLNAAGHLYQNTILPLGRRMVQQGQLKGDAKGNPLAPMGDELWMPRTHSREFALNNSGDAYANAYLPAHDKALRNNARKEREGFGTPEDVNAAERAVASYEADVVTHNKNIAKLSRRLKARLKKGETAADRKITDKANRAEIDQAKADLKSVKEELKTATSKGGRAKIGEASTRANVKEVRRLTPARDVAKSKFDATTPGSPEWKAAKEELDIAEISLGKSQKQLDADLKAMAEYAPENAAWIKNMTLEGQAEARLFYVEMRNKIVSSGDGVTEYSGMPVMNDIDGELKMVDGRTVIGATADLPPEALGRDIVLGLRNALNRQNAQLLVQEDMRFKDATFGNVYEKLDIEQGNKLDLMQEEGASQRKITRMNKQYDKDRRDLKLTFKSFYNIREPVVHQGLQDMGSNIKALSVMQGLGSVMLSASPEIAAGLSSVGITGYMRHAISAIMDNKAMRDLSKVQQAEYYTGAQIDNVARMAEHGDYETVGSDFTRGMMKGADFAVDKGFGLGYWTRGITRQVGVAMQSKIGRLMKKAKIADDGTISGLSKMDRLDLARIGFGDDTIRLAKIEVDAHSNMLFGGVVDINTKAWGNKSIAEHVKNSISQEVHNVIIKPSTGSTPFIGRNMAGSMFLQFKQFILASTSKYLLADMQRFMHGDMRAVQKQVAFLGLGMLQWEIRRNLYGIEDEDETWAEKVKNGFAFGGGGGIATDIYNYTDELVLSGSNAKFRGNKDLYSALGPWAKSVNDLAVSAAGTASLIKSGELSNEQIRAMRQSLPANTLLPVRKQINKAEEYVKDVYN